MADTSILNLYQKKVSENGRVTYEPIDYKKPFIRGFSLGEIFNILDCLTIERRYEMQFCRENLSKYAEIYRKEQDKIIAEAIKQTFDNFENLEDKEK